MKPTSSEDPAPRPNEAGFTLMEAMVTMLVMVTVMFALYAVFDASVRVFRQGDDESEAMSEARTGLSRLERELRAAAPYEPGSASHLFFDYSNPATPAMPSSASVTFGDDLDGRCGLRKVEGEGCSPQANPREEVSYYVNGGGLLIRHSNNQYRSVVGDVEKLEFGYLDQTGREATSEGEISRVDVTLVVRVGDGSQRLSTSVALRNRAG